MNLGAFSISLAVKDIHASAAFYTKLGFEPFEGDLEQNWLVMKNGDHLIGLFAGMFEENILTFNPGWDQSANELSDFTDIRELYQNLAKQGLEDPANPEFPKSGPASFTLTDPDGNTILFDQHR